MKRYFDILTRLRNRYLMGFDLIGLALIPSAAMLIWSDNISILNSYSMALLAYSVVMICLKSFAYYGTGLYNQFWAYASAHEMVMLLTALFAGAVLEIAVSYGLLYPFHLLPEDLPRSIPIISALLTGFWIAGSRVTIRIAFMMANRSDVW